MKYDPYILSVTMPILCNIRVNVATLLTWKWEWFHSSNKPTNKITFVMKRLSRLEHDFKHGNIHAEY